MQQVGSKGVSILTTIILARILLPKDFGLIGMLAVFIEVSQGITNGGFNQALIQKKGADDEDFSSVFYINLVVSSFLYVLLFFTAPLIAAFYEQPVLTSLTRALALVFVIDAFSYVQRAKLSKAMKFKTLMLIQIPSAVLSAIVAVAMAYSGFGVWSLVAQQVVQRSAFSVQIWFYSKWKPLLTFNATKVKKLFNFGSRLMVATLLNKIYQNVYLVIIGKFFPIEVLGYYKTANTLVRTPTQALAESVKSVTFPTFSIIQDDNKKLKEGYRKTILQVFFLIFPIMIVAFVMATPLFRFVLTEKWLPAVPYFQLLCIIGIVKPVSIFNLEVVTVKGRSDLYLRLNIIKKIIITIGVAFSLQYGIWALLSFQAVNILFEYFVNSYYSGKFIQYPIKEQLIDLLPIIVLGLSMGVVIYSIDNLIFNLSDFIRLCLGMFSGLCFYWIGAKALNISSYRDIKQIVLGKLKPYNLS